LKSDSGWNENGNGTDNYGFSALPGGGLSSEGYFHGAGSYGGWWTATEGDGSNAYGRSTFYDDDDVGEGNYDKGFAFSVRCVADSP
ncbi:MAG: hypothetical protein LBC59_07710, partial [Chitinispirillales bacterium]|jgi:uncharacterized protein (TIGR02145 family)|nr:hypothetical protein [Chitinispirillales bacterium]